MASSFGREYSPLPGKDRLKPHIVIAEHRGRNGGTRAFSTVSVPFENVGERMLEIASFSEAVEMNWESVAKQRTFVWARFADEPGRTVAGAVFEHPYPPREDSLDHPIVWYANPVEVFDESLRSKGIGSALYGHLSELGYLLMKADAQQGSPDGRCVPADRLWNRLHPDYDSDLEAGRLPVSKVQMNEDTLASLVKRYGIDPTGPVFDLATLLDQRLWGLLNWP